MIALYCQSGTVRIFAPRASILFMHSGRLLIALGVLAVTGWAQQPSAGVAGPVTGFVFTPSGAIRPMVGLPGAAYLGGSVAAGLSTASVAPDGSAALAVPSNGQLILYSGLRATPVPLAVNGAIAAVDRFAWAPGGTAAVYSSRSGQGQILMSVGPSPAAGAAIDLSSLPGPVTALAFDGLRMLVGVSGDAGGIYLASAGGAGQRIAAAAKPSAIALAGSSLYFADSQSQQILQIQNYAGTPGVVLFANDSSINAPAGLQVSADGQRLLAANAGNQKVVVYDIVSRTPVETLSLSFAPTRLDRFGDSSVFLLNDGSQGPLYVVQDSAAAKPAVYFVPSPNQTHPAKAPIRLK